VTPRRAVRDVDEAGMLLLLDPVYGRLVARDGQPCPIADYPPAPTEPLPGFRIIWPCEHDEIVEVAV
jgi:hypothetical protein